MLPIIKVEGDNLIAAGVAGRLTLAGYPVVRSGHAHYTFDIAAEPEKPYVVLDTAPNTPLEQACLYEIGALTGGVLVQIAGGNEDDQKVVLRIPMQLHAKAESGILHALDQITSRGRARPWLRLRQAWLKLGFGLSAWLLLASVAAAQGTIITGRDFATGIVVPNVADTSNGAIRVNVVAGGGVGSGTSSAFGGTFPASGTAAGFFDGTNMQGARVFDLDTGGGTQYLFGVNLRASGSGGTAEIPFPGALGSSGGFKVECLGGTCGGAAAFNDNTAFTAGTTSISNVGAVFNDGLAAVTSGNAAAPRITSRRALHTNLRDNSGNELGTVAAPLYTNLSDGTDTLAITSSGSIFVEIGGQVSVLGTLGNNDGPQSINVGTVGGFANAAAQTWIEGNQVGFSTDLNGHMRVRNRVRNAADSAFIEPATDRTTAASPFATRLSDGASFYDGRSIRALTFAGDKVDASGSAVTISSGTITTITNVVHVDDNSGSLTVDGPVTDAQLRATPVPVSGTVTANAGTNLNTSALALEATQLTGNTSLASVKTNTDPLVAAGAGGYIRQDSTATIAKETGGNLATIATQTKVRGTAAGPVMVPATEADTTLLASNTARVGWQVCNQSGSALLVKFGSGANQFSYNVRVPSGSCFADTTYTGQVNGAWFIGADRYALVSESQ